MATTFVAKLREHHEHLETEPLASEALAAVMLDASGLDWEALHSGVVLLDVPTGMRPTAFDLLRLVYGTVPSHVVRPDGIRYDYKRKLIIATPTDMTDTDAWLPNIVDRRVPSSARSARRTCGPSANGSGKRTPTTTRGSRVRRHEHAEGDPAPVDAGSRSERHGPRVGEPPAMDDVAHGADVQADHDGCLRL